jgi:hypothetical protein
MKTPSTHRSDASDARAKAAFLHQEAASNRALAIKIALKDRRSNATSAGIPGIPDRYRSASIVITRELHTDEA